ncbi:hypothetical protein ACFFX0_26920 [Citricoccus parietis]|uniref:Uncharacterized protein n=1 Tax=Citricoccus parietis TaxID=592307 RepID=A0ABV5G6S1_9MICC
MKAVVSKTRRRPAWTSASISRCWAPRSTKGMDVGLGGAVSREPP